jgi:DNA (cytosine-5)-methyltransferase 1
MINEKFKVVENSIHRIVKSGNFQSESKLKIPDNLINDDLGQLWWQSFLRAEKPEYATTKNFNIVDLFCSAGGLTLGAFDALNAVGLRPRVVMGCDMDNGALAVYRKNFNPYMHLNENVASLIDYHVYDKGNKASLAYKPKIINESLKKLTGKVDLLIAGPPCQGHSSLNNHTRQDDPRNQLYLATASIAIALDAKAVVIENVARVLEDKGEVVNGAKALFAENGYFVSEDILNAAELGGGQSRRRHFLIATKFPHTPLTKVAKTLKKSNITLRHLISDLEDIPKKSAMDYLTKTSEVNMERIKFLFDNDLYDLPNHVRPDCHKDGHSYQSVYGRLHWDQPAPTITTGFLSPGRGRFIHPSRMRVLTPREAARIQGFPDWYDFTNEQDQITPSHLSKWIGDAVPSMLGYTAVLTAISGYEEYISQEP